MLLWVSGTDLLADLPLHPRACRAIGEPNPIPRPFIRGRAMPSVGLIRLLVRSVEGRRIEWLDQRSPADGMARPRMKMPEAGRCQAPIGYFAPITPPRFAADIGQNCMSVRGTPYAFSEGSWAWVVCAWRVPSVVCRECTRAGAACQRRCARRHLRCDVLLGSGHARASVPACMSGWMDEWMNGRGTMQDSRVGGTSLPSSHPSVHPSLGQKEQSPCFGTRQALIGCQPRSCLATGGRAGGRGRRRGWAGGGWRGLRRPLRAGRRRGLRRRRRGWGGGRPPAG